MEEQILVREVTGEDLLGFSSRWGKFVEYKIILCLLQSCSQGGWEQSNKWISESLGVQLGKMLVSIWTQQTRFSAYMPDYKSAVNVLMATCQVFPWMLFYRHKLRRPQVMRFDEGTTERGALAGIEGRSWSISAALPFALGCSDCRSRRDAAEIVTQRRPSRWESSVCKSPVCKNWAGNLLRGFRLM